MQRTRNIVIWLLSAFLLMSLSHSATASGLGRSHISVLTARDGSYTFPITPVGETSGVCTNVCYCTNHNNCTCDQSGTVQLNHDLSAPFSIVNYRLQGANNSDDCAGGSPVTLPVFIGVGQKLSYTVEFSPTGRGTFSDYLNLSGYVFSVSGSTPVGGESDLVPYQPSGWSGPLVISDAKGTQRDSPTLKSTEPLYVSWAVLNAGDLSVTSSFYVDLLLDGSFAGRWVDNNTLDPNYYIDITDFTIGPLAPGSHSLELIPDSAHTTLGSSENYSKTFKVIQPGPPPPPKQPTTSISWYIRATGKTYGTDSGLYSWAYTAGKSAGSLNNSKGGANFVILDFGSPVQAQDGSYGAAGFGRPLTAVEITNTAKSFIRGYDSIAHHALFLAIGTSNNAGVKRASVTQAHAEAWAQMLLALEQWIVSGGFRVHLSAASDAELGWNSPQVTGDWFNTFVDEIAASGINIPVYDFGDAAGCPQTPATTKPQRCPVKNSPYHWTQGDIAGLGALYVPEIYNKSTAIEWTEIAQYMDLSLGATGLIRAVLTQNQACAQRGGSRACPGMDNTPAVAWQEMVAALSGTPSSSEELSNLLWSTDIRYTY